MNWRKIKNNLIFENKKYKLNLYNQSFLDFNI